MNYKTQAITYTFRHCSIFLILSVLSLAVWAEVPKRVQKRVSRFRTSQACLPPSASQQLDVNNVRALLHNGGDMWWDLVGDPRYEIPKGSNRHSMFAGSLWIGGIDRAGQLRIAAQTYRQTGVDFWAGPLTEGEASTDEQTCDRYNRMFKINKAEIDAFRADYADNNIIDNPENYPNVFSWPGAGTEFSTDAQGNFIRAVRPDGTEVMAAPFVDIDNNPFEYNPVGGDYPDIEGDQAIWWIINDKGDVHTETGGEPIGIEIHMLAFAFTTANAVNDMTFYKQTVINRSSQALTETYIGQWADVDVGFAFNDYVGCDTIRGLGFGYNATADDDGANGYGLNPPACGVDFFQGPLADANDGRDNDRDGLIDEPGETIIMSKFIYYNNDFSLIGNPEVAQHYYNYLRGQWKDGTLLVDNFTNGGTGNGFGSSSPGEPSDFIYTGDACANTGWTEDNAGNPKNEDRRFLISAGPFTLQPGAVNEIITGVVWARGFFSDQFGSVCELLQADDVAQALFDADFNLLDGPDAPNLEISEYNRELVLSWGYDEADRNVRNNFNESYVQADPVLKANNVADSTFEFQGYIVYQLADQTVGPNELNDPDRARIVVQTDIEDGIGTIVNRNLQSVEGLNTPIVVDEVMVQGADEGLIHSAQVTTDLFAQGADNQLKNYTTYYYAVIAYAHNDTSSDGREFIPGNRFYRVVAAMPHEVSFEQGGTITRASYGDGVPVIQIAGVGNGGNFLRIAEETENRILAPPYFSESITYEGGFSPIAITVVDPKKLKPSFYRLEVPGRRFIETETISEDAASGSFIIDSIFAEWILLESSTFEGPYNPIFNATFSERHDFSSNRPNDPQPVVSRPEPLTGTERVIPERGISIRVEDVTPAGDTLDINGNGGIIGSEIVFSDPTQAWLSGLQDNDNAGGGVWNWIRSDERTDQQFKVAGLFDKSNAFETLVNGQWAPFGLARSFNNDPEGGGDIAPALPVGLNTNNRGIGTRDLISLSDLPDVDIVFTSDVSKWSRAAVVETSPNSGLGSGAWPLSAKWRDNVDQSGQSEGTRTINSHGLGWFPGYAINVNTGERLNIFFGESDWDQLNNGNDMLFNPTSELGQNQERVGGRHYVYVSNTRYDEFESLIPMLRNADEAGINNLSDAIFFPSSGNNLADVYKDVAYVGIPLINSGFTIDRPQDIPTDARVSIRINRPLGSRPGRSGYPTFLFNTVELAATFGETNVAKDALEKVLVVPNPYYAYSAYETGQLDNRIKITNLPQKARVSLFTINGQLVRQFNKDSDEPDLDWDLRNHDGVPIASGVYIVHVDAFELGEKILKIFVVMRQIDLDNF